MIIAIASGKGGTGKTTVAASLLSVWDRPVIAVDMDVEEPNLHLFLRPELEDEIPSNMEVPEVNLNRCNYCGACSEICQFKAISVFNEAILTFPEMCHGCGACFAVCPEDALTPGARELGAVCRGKAESGKFLMGRLRVGEAMSPPLMRSVKQYLSEMLSENSAEQAPDVIIDAPPGVSCPAVNAVMDTDAIVLVTEPTPFGLYDLKLAVEAFQSMEIPMTVVINRAGLGDSGVHDFCKARGLSIAAEIPYDRKIAESYSEGAIIAQSSESLKSLFCDLRDALCRGDVLTSPAKEVTHG